MSSSNTEDSKSLYDYDPNGSLPVVAGVIFVILLALHLWQAFKAKTWFYMSPFIVGIVVEAVGYFLRKISVGDQDSLGLYAGQQLAIVVAPSLLAASLYQCFGRCVLFVGAEYSPVRPTWVTRIFVAGDVVSFLVQATGASLFAKDDLTKDERDRARLILIGGLSIQAIFLAVFLFLPFIYTRRYNKANSSRTSKAIKILPILQLVSGLILVRCIYRFAEFVTSNNGTGYLLEHEVWFWIGETLLIITACSIFGIYYPARWIPNDKSLRESTSVLPKHVSQDLAYTGGPAHEYQGLTSLPPSQGSMLNIPMSYSN
ncbi:RTA1-domain-containing protein [Atractiella rhizophila]|nr:RTA1-domain-containing protein [Atractiella rhizophila]